MKSINKQYDDCEYDLKQLSTFSRDVLERLFEILLSISGIDLLDAMYCRVPLTRDFNHGEFSTTKRLDLSHALVLLPAQSHRPKQF